MGSSSSVMRPQELLEFRKLNTSIDNVEIPARAESRTVTDKKGFILYGIGVLILLPFLIYCLTLSDSQHLFKAADDCGNYCGFDNEKIENVACSGKDYTMKPFLYNGKCVEDCPGELSLREMWFGKCIDDNKLDRQYDRFKRSTFETEETKFEPEKVYEGTTKEWWKFLITVVITIGLCIFVLVLLRFMPAPFVWAIIIFSILILIIIDIALWYVYTEAASADPGGDSGKGALVLAVGFTIIVLVILSIIICLLKKIGLVIQLYKETTKALAAMPMLVFIPVITTIIQIIIVGAFFTTTALLISSHQVVVYGNTVRYEFTPIIWFTLLYNILIFTWTVRIIDGIQYMSIAGSVARWFFSRNKQYLDWPICSSIRVTLRFHLGTITFGSLILTLFAVVKAIIRCIIRNSCCRCLVILCCNKVEILLKFLSENSYIETAIHGQSYLRSAKRATKLLLTNISSVIAINCVGDFILGMIILVVTVIATGISYALFMNLGPLAAVPTTICFIINVIVVVVMFGPFQTIIDTLFICFCEDSVVNDGVARPYFMSRGLMEFVENSKKLYGQNGK